MIISYANVHTRYKYMPQRFASSYIDSKRGCSHINFHSFTGKSGSKVEFEIEAQLFTSFYILKDSYYEKRRVVKFVHTKEGWTAEFDDVKSYSVTTTVGKHVTYGTQVFVDDFNAEAPDTLSYEQVQTMLDNRRGHIRVPISLFVAPMGLTFHWMSFKDFSNCYFYKPTCGGYKKLWQEEMPTKVESGRAICGESKISQSPKSEKLFEAKLPSSWMKQNEAESCPHADLKHYSTIVNAMSVNSDTLTTGYGQTFTEARDSPGNLRVRVDVWNDEEFKKEYYINKEEKEMNNVVDNKLYIVTAGEHKDKYVAKVAVNAVGHFVVEAKGTAGSYFAVEKEHLERVLPYSVDVRYISERTGYKENYSFWAEADSLEVGDLIIGDYSALMVVTAIDTKAESATKWLVGSVFKAAKVIAAK